MFLANYIIKLVGADAVGQRFLSFTKEIHIWIIALCEQKPNAHSENEASRTAGLLFRVTCALLS